MTAPIDLSFARLITALDPWLDRIVVIGGWAHRLYFCGPHASEAGFAPLTTYDVDIALPAVPDTKAPNIWELLQANGFEPQFAGDATPPATRYRPKNDDSGFYAEFLTPLSGPANMRDGRRKATMQVAGVNSQRLRYVDLLLQYPWEVRLDPGRFQLAGKRIVRVANPVSFLAQKLLVHKVRNDRAKKAKDILYIHDTLQCLGPRLEALRDEWNGRIAPALLPGNRKAVVRESKRLFAGTNDRIREAAEIAKDRTSPESILETCRYGLELIFT